MQTQKNYISCAENTLILLCLSNGFLDLLLKFHFHPLKEEAFPQKVFASLILLKSNALFLVLSPIIERLLKQVSFIKNVFISANCYPFYLLRKMTDHCV